MTSINTFKSISAVIILSLPCVSSVFAAAPPAYTETWGNQVEASHQASVDLFNDHQNQITQNKLDADNVISGLKSHVSSIDSDLNRTKDAVLVVNNDLQQTKADLNTQINNAKTTAIQQSVNAEKDLQQTKTDLNSKIQHLQTTTTQQSTSVEKDLQQTKTNMNKQMTQLQTTATQQSASVAKDLQDAKQFLTQQQSSSNAQFKSLKDEMDDNKKESRSGAASAIAIASMPQVEAGQSVMFSAGAGTFKDEQALSVGASFHAGAATVIKAGVSDSTNNDFAMGAGIGIGF